MMFLNMEVFEEFIDLNAVAQWVTDHTVSIFVIIVGAALLKRFGMIPLEGFVRRAVKTSRFQTEEQHQQREDTLLDVASSIFGVAVFILAVILLLIELEINLQPFLAAGGAASLILGFGAQNIMKDLFAGIYVITESQYQVGDIVDLDGDAGVVEDISLRMCTLRDLDGTVHHIPHGTVNRAKNLSKDFTRINIDIGVAYDTDIEKAAEVIDSVGKELAKDEEWRHSIMTPPQFLRIENFADSSIDLKIIGETKPGKQWAAAGELRKRLKVAFDEAGIEIPFPQRVIHQTGK